ncbi:MAG: nicotinate-nucleotide--dimethylbenzimidazole phosphoribosyltransferase [Actinomycetota bacterium]|nr:nicotinate-nucleotide--dimethylbenzimidazole phosphoribosyltransferase [Actinomycetota bacterium]
MTDLVELAAGVQWPDDGVAHDLPESAPGRGYGRLEELARWLGALQGVAPPKDPARARIVAFGGSPCPALIAELAEAGVRVLDTTVWTDAQSASALAAGAALADDEIDRGADLFVIAVPQASLPASVLVAVLTNTEPVRVMQTGAATPAQAWAEQAIKIRDGRRRAFGLRGDPDGLLAAAAGVDIAAATGFLLRAAARRTPTVLDGVGAAAAALLAHAAQPRAARWWQAADESGHPAHALALLQLGQRPLLNLGVSRADGTAGALALLALRGAVRTVASSGSVAPAQAPSARDLDMEGTT